MPVTQPKNYRLEDYLEFETNSEERHEYLDGEIILMTGGTPNHNQIAGNLYAALNFILKRQAYRVFVLDQRLWIPQKRIYTYPDVMIIQGELQLQTGRTDTILNPIMIAEVLSKSTRSYDKDKKFEAYRTIASFKEYILIDQYTQQVEHYKKTGDHQWLFTEYNSTESDNNKTLSLSSVPFEIELADLYNRVDFTIAD